MLGQDVLVTNDSHHSFRSAPTIILHLISQWVLHSGTKDTHLSRYAPNFIDDWQLLLPQNVLGASTNHRLIRLVLESLFHLVFHSAPH